MRLCEFERDRLIRESRADATAYIVTIRPVSSVRMLLSHTLRYIGLPPRLAWPWKNSVARLASLALRLPAL